MRQTGLHKTITEERPIKDFASLSELALSCGFTYIGILDTKKIKPDHYARRDCRTELCSEFNKNWACPPAVGELERCTELLRGCQSGLILQYTAKLSDPYDITERLKAARVYEAALREFSREIRKEIQNSFIFDRGACDVCPECTYPKKCRFPDKRTYSLEAHGLTPEKLCADNYVPAAYGSDTVTFTGCVLFRLS